MARWADSPRESADGNGLGCGTTDAARAAPAKETTYSRATAEIYDLYFPADRGAEANRVAALAPPGARRLLEPMIGTGEVAALLARRGYQVTGVDTSPDMLEIAGRRLVGETATIAARLQLTLADVSCVELPAQHFDLAYVNDGSWNLLLDRVQRLAALRRILGSLRPGGRLALELFGPLSTSGRSEPRTFAPLRPVPSGWEVSKTAVVTRDAPAQTMQIEEEISAQGRLWRQTIRLQLLHPAEVTAEFLAAGFTRINIVAPGEVMAPRPGLVLALAARPSQP